MVAFGGLCAVGHDAFVGEGLADGLGEVDARGGAGAVVEGGCCCVEDIFVPGAGICGERQAFLDIGLR